MRDIIKIILTLNILLTGCVAFGQNRPGKDIPYQNSFRPGSFKVDFSQNPIRAFQVGDGTRWGNYYSTVRPSIDNINRDRQALPQAAKYTHWREVRIHGMGEVGYVNPLPAPDFGGRGDAIQIFVPKSNEIEGLVEVIGDTQIVPTTSGPSLYSLDRSALYGSRGYASFYNASLGVPLRAVQPPLPGGIVLDRAIPLEGDVLAGLGRAHFDGVRFIFDNHVVFEPACSKAEVSAMYWAVFSPRRAVLVDCPDRKCRVDGPVGHNAQEAIGRPLALGDDLLARLVFGFDTWLRWRETQSPVPNYSNPFRSLMDAYRQGAPILIATHQIFRHLSGSVMATISPDARFRVNNGRIVSKGNLIKITLRGIYTSWSGIDRFSDTAPAWEASERTAIDIANRFSLYEAAHSELTALGRLMRLYGFLANIREYEERNGLHTGVALSLRS